MKYGHPFSVEVYACDCFNSNAPPREDCPHPKRKRRAFADELTDAQLKFLFYGKQERERIKKNKAEEKKKQNAGPKSGPPRHNI